MDEKLKRALEAQKMFPAMTSDDRFFNEGIDAAIAAIEQHKPVVRMLTDFELEDCAAAAKPGWSWSACVQRKFAEVNGLTIGEHG